MKNRPLSKDYQLLEPGPVVLPTIDPAQKNPKTIHHHGYGRFAVNGEMIKLKSKMP